ncbi:MAG: hypothetical protein WCF99_02100 [Chloroflexales bacterium]
MRNLPSPREHIFTHISATITGRLHRGAQSGRLTSRHGSLRLVARRRGRFWRRRSPAGGPINRMPMQ